MALLNYTTQIATSKTASEISVMLVKAGASAIQQEYDEGILTALAFVIETAYGPRRFTLPVHADAVQRTLVKQRVPQRFRDREQAERVAWRIVKDWIAAQLALVETGMTTLDQVMFPYMLDLDGTTLYELYVGQQLALEAGGS